MDEQDKNPKKRGLGRGLSALFEDNEDILYGEGAEQAATSDQSVAPATAHTPSGKRVQMIPVGDLEAAYTQPRQRFDEKAIANLAESIAEHGILQPLIVRPNPAKDGQYQIIAGERRWRAAQKAQLHEVPAIIREFTDDEALQIALIENIQRENLNPVEEARAYQTLVDDFGHTQEELSSKLGKSRSHLANTMRLLKLPSEVLGMVEDGDLSAGHARALIGYDDAEKLAHHIGTKGLSVRQVEKMVAEGKAPQSDKGEKPAKKAKDVDTLALEAEISNLLGLKVTIDLKNQQSGALKIEFKTLEQLDDVLHRLSK